jgi:hypothetical protein
VVLRAAPCHSEGQASCFTLAISQPALFQPRESSSAGFCADNERDCTRSFPNGHENTGHVPQNQAAIFYQAGR